MNILIVGNGKGSWSIRGEQIGAALGARVTSCPVAADWTWADVAILIKRSALTYSHQARAAGVPIVWDALDFWRQPDHNAYGEVGAMDALRWHLDQIKPTVTIGATNAMAQACDGVYIPHHAWAYLSPSPARERVQTVAYEGNPVYLGQWHKQLVEACQKRGWTFLVNPSDLREADILVSVRDGIWNGYMPREWKSGIKVVNAIAAGRPIIGQSSAALSELRPPCAVVESWHVQLDAAFDVCEPYHARAAAVETCRQIAPLFTVDAIAKQYRDVLDRVVETSCAA